MPGIFVLRQYGHERARAVHARIVLLSDGFVGAKRHLRCWSLLCDGLEHGDAKPLHESHLLSARQFRADRLSRVWLLRDERHGQLFALHGWLLLQHDGLVGRVGRLQRGLLLPYCIDVDHAADLPNPLLLPGAEFQHDDIAHLALLPGERHECADCL